MFGTCCDTVCKKIKPVAYRGRPNHKIGPIDYRLAPGITEDAYENSGEIFGGVNYNLVNGDNEFSYSVTGDEKNVYHCCGSSGIHVYSLDSFYATGQLQKNWMIPNLSAHPNEMPSDNVRTFEYGSPHNGQKILGCLNSGAASQYGREPNPFHGWYDCSVVGNYMFAARGIAGVSVYKFNEDKSSAEEVKFKGSSQDFKIEGGLVRRITCSRMQGGLILVMFSTAPYTKPQAVGDVDQYDIPSVPPYNFGGTSPPPAGGWTQLEYINAEKNGYCSQTTDGFSSLPEPSDSAVYCCFWMDRDWLGNEVDRWVVNGEGSLSLEEIESTAKKETKTIADIAYWQDLDLGSSEITSIDMKPNKTYTGPVTKDQKFNWGKYDLSWGVANAIDQNSDFVSSGSICSREIDIEMTLTSSEDDQGNKFMRCVPSILSNGALSCDGSNAILSLSHVEFEEPALFSTRYWDGSVGALSSNPGANMHGVHISTDAGLTVLSLLSLKFGAWYWNWYYFSGYWTTYDRGFGHKVDPYSVKFSSGLMTLSLYQGGLFVSCNGGDINTWENMDDTSYSDGSVENLSTQGDYSISTLGEGCTSSLNIIDSWSDGKTVFAADCIQPPVLCGPRSLGLHWFPSSVVGRGSPEVDDLRRSYMYRMSGGSPTVGGGLLACSIMT